MRIKTIGITTTPVSASVTALVLMAGGLAAGGVPAVADEVSATSTAALPFDFDGDGYADLASGVPGEDIGRRASKSDAGAVHVLYGSASGPTANDEIWHQDTPGIKGGSEKEDFFGGVTVSGDFDADGYADLAVGIPDEDLGGREDAGAVQIIYGGPGGLTTRDQLWHQNTAGIPGANEDIDVFGSALAAGDFDGDGYCDLAIGSWLEEFGSDPYGRAVVLYGSGSGLTASGLQVWHPGLLGDRSEYLGSAVVAGDFDGDGWDDLGLVASAPVAGGDPGATLLHIVPGSAAGLTATGSQILDADVLNTGGAWVDAFYGPVVADFHADGRDEHAASGLDGTVGVLYSGDDGLDPATAEAFDLDAGDPVSSPLFSAKAAGDLTGDGAAELAVGRPISDSAGGDTSYPGGAVYLLTGSATGLEVTPGVLWQDTPGIPGRDESEDAFGASLTVLGRSDGSPGWLVVGDPGEALGSTVYAGRVVVVPGSSTGLVPTSARAWHQDSAGIRGKAEDGDFFGVMYDFDVQPVP